MLHPASEREGYSQETRSGAATTTATDPPRAAQYALIPGALSPSEVAAINTRLDALERMGQRYRDGEVPGTYHTRNGNFPEKREFSSDTDDIASS